MDNLKMNLLDRAIGFVSPNTAYRRMCGRELLRSFYTGGDRGTRKGNWDAINASPEITNRGDRDLVRARARDLERNDDMLKAIILARERNCIGSGIELQVTAADENGDELPLCEEIERKWKAWGRSENCTVTGQQSFNEVLKMISRRLYVDGGILVLFCIVQGKFKLQLREVDDLDLTIVEFNGRRVIGGVEVDDFLAPVAFHLAPRGIDSPTLDRVRVEAKDVLFLMEATRPGQIREFSPAASNIAKIDDINLLMAAALKKEQVQACFGIAITSDGGGGGYVGRGLDNPTGANNDEPPRELLFPGIIKRLKPGEKIESISPAGMSSTADNMIRTVQRQAGSGAGLSYEAVSRDMSQVNYSSARQGLLEDKRTYGDLQNYIIEHFLRPTYLRWLDWLCLLENRQELFSSKYREEIMWIPPGSEWIDPLKEANANKIALETNQTTLQKILAGRGDNYRDVIKQRKKERDLLGESEEENKLSKRKKGEKLE